MTLKIMKNIPEAIFLDRCWKLAEHSMFCFSVNNSNSNNEYLINSR